MDASEYLRKHGWRGLGYSLDQRDRGIKKPLLISKKVDVLGVGLNKHAAVSDQWWLRAFDDGLKSFGTGQQTALAQVRQHGVDRGGLYTRFVKGGLIPSSFEDKSSGTAPANFEQPSQSTSTSSTDSEEMAVSKKRKRANELNELNEKHSRKKANTNSTPAAACSAEEAKAIGCRTKAIDERVTELVHEAHRRGIIVAGPNEIRKGIKPPKKGGQMKPASLEFQRILELPGLRDQLDGAGDNGKSTKSQKLAREKMKRIFKKAARLYLIEEDERVHGNSIVTPSSKGKKKKATKEDSGADRDHSTIAGGILADNLDENAASSGAHTVLPPEEASALRQVKIDCYRAMKANLTLQEYRDNVAKGIIQVPVIDMSQITDQKRAEYARRAAEKGITLHKYIKRRQDKYAAKQADKLSSEWQREIRSAAATDTADPTHLAPRTGQSGADRSAFMIDTFGDERLAAAGKSVDLARGTAFARRALAALTENKAVTIDDDNGVEIFNWQPGMPIPHDPRIWEGVVVKGLPKAVRQARRDWMRVERAAKKARKAAATVQSTSAGVKNKSRGERKVEEREKLMSALLAESRKVSAGGGTHIDTSVKINGIAHIPLVKVETPNGQDYSKAEKALARTVARRVLRSAKKEEKKTGGKATSKRGRN